MGQNQHPGPFLETREQELSFGTFGFKIGLIMLWEIINLEKVRVYSSPTVVTVRSLLEPMKSYLGLVFEKELME